MNQLGELGYEIWDIEFGDHTSEIDRESKSLLISGYLEANIGELNILINTDFKLDETKDEVIPELKYEEKAIFTQLYLKDYLLKQARNTLRSATDTSYSNEANAQPTDWTELREGDSSIKRSIPTASSKNTSAKLFQDASKEALEDLKRMIHSYNMYGSIPSQIAGKDAPI